MLTLRNPHKDCFLTFVLDNSELARYNYPGHPKAQFKLHTAFVFGLNYKANSTAINPPQ